MNQSGLTNNFNKINMSNSRCVAKSERIYYCQSEQNSFKIVNNKNSTKDKHTVKEFRKKIIFEKSNNLQSQPVELPSNTLISPPAFFNAPLIRRIKKRKRTRNLNKKKIVFSFGSSNRHENEANNLQSNQIISNSMLSLSGKSNSKKYSFIKLNKADNLINNFNKNNKYLKKTASIQASTDESPTSTKSLLAFQPPHLPYSHSFTIQNSKSNHATSKMKSTRNLLLIPNNSNLNKRNKFFSETKNINLSYTENLSNIKDTSSLFLKRLSSLSNFKRNESL